MSQKDKESPSPEVRMIPRDPEAPSEESWEAPNAAADDWDRRRLDNLAGLDADEGSNGRSVLVDIPVGYKVLFVSGLLALLGWGVMKMWEGAQATREHLQTLAIEEQREKQETEEAMTFLRRLEIAVRGYLTATSLEEKMNYVRQSERIAPLMQEYYRERPIVPRTYQKLDQFASLGLDKRSFLLVNVDLEDYVDGRTGVNLVVEETEDGQILVDWEADVAYQPVSLENFLADKPEKSVDLRLYVSKDNFYNYEFSDPERYQSLKLGVRDSDLYFFGYAERGSRALRDIENLLKKSRTGYEPAILRVRFLPDTKSKRSLFVEDMVEPRWIFVDDPGGNHPESEN